MQPAAALFPLRSRSLLGLMLFSLLAGFFPLAAARAEGRPPQPRQQERQVTRTVYHWQLAYWETGAAVCDLYISHESWPSYSEVRRFCGESVLQAWLSTPACQAAVDGQDASLCHGLLLRYVQPVSLTYTETVQLPGIQFRLMPSADCRVGEWCSQRPVLTLQAVEPLQGYEIERVYLRLNGRERSFRRDQLQITLPLTDEKGSWLTYWAESSYGDASSPQRVRYRALPSEDGSAFRFDLLTPSQAGNLPYGALLWQVFPPAEALPALLQKPDSPSQLYSEREYLYLAGYLIRTGQASAEDCPDGGLLPSGAASVCGAQAAAAPMIDWQNRYNAQIFQAAEQYGVPPRLLKQLIAQESQFIGEGSQPYERGLGQLTANGADMLLTWNTEYFLQVCLERYQDEDLCAGGYSSLDEIHRTMLRKDVLDTVGGPHEIETLAAALAASAAQVGQTVQNISRTAAGEASTYEDLWKMSVANYYGGSGCLGQALQAARQEQQPLEWDSLVAYLPPACERMDEYVQRVWQWP